MLMIKTFGMLETYSKSYQARQNENDKAKIDLKYLWQ